MIGKKATIWGYKGRPKMAFPPRPYLHTNTNIGAAKKSFIQKALNSKKWRIFVNVCAGARAEAGKLV